jgi:hypothetical protein
VGIVPHILNLSITWRLTVIFIPWLLYSQEKSLCFPLDRRMGGLQSWSGQCGNEKNLSPRRMKSCFSSSVACSLATILSHITYPSHTFPMIFQTHFSQLLRLVISLNHHHHHHHFFTFCKEIKIIYTWNLLDTTYKLHITTMFVTADLQTIFIYNL